MLNTSTMMLHVLESLIYISVFFIGCVFLPGKKDVLFTFVSVAHTKWLVLGTVW